MSVPLSDKTLSDKNYWLRCFNPKPEAKIRLFCFPPAGFGTLFFRDWLREEIFPEVEVQAICLPGRENRLREPLFTSVDHLVNALLPSLINYLDKPFAIFGHSLGAIIGFQVALQLQKQDVLLPKKLFVSARQAPGVDLQQQRLHLLSDADLKQKLRLYGGTAEAVLENDELMNLFLPTIRADLQMNEQYGPTNEILLNCPITAFAGLTDPVTSVSDVNRWTENTQREFKLHTYAGGHFPAKQETQILLNTIRTELNFA